MSYIANQYNYATPLQSAKGLNNETSGVADLKYFILSDNKLDGSYIPITDDVGLWGTSVSTESGVLPTPFIVTVTETLTINAFRIQGSQYSYPVAFTVKFYNGNELLYSINEVANTKAEYVHYMPATLNVTSYEITVTKINRANNVVRLYNVYNPAYVKRTDKATFKASERFVAALQLTGSDTLRVDSSSASELTGQDVFTISVSDSLKVKESSATSMHVSAMTSDTVKLKEAGSSTVQNTVEAADTLKATQSHISAILNTIDVTTDRLTPKLKESVPHVLNTIDTTYDKLNVKHLVDATLTNVHTKMKEASRRIYGKVYITYDDPMLDAATTISTNMEAYNSQVNQVLDGHLESDDKFFTLYENNLSGDYAVSDADTQVGWVSKQVSDEDGTFNTNPYIQIDFSARPIVSLPIHFNRAYGSVPEDFTVDIIRESDTITKHFSGNTASMVEIIDEPVSDVKAVKVTITKTAPGTPANIVEILKVSTVLYNGYQDESDLISIDVLEELTYKDDVEALGGVSANEATIVLDNSSRDFFFNNANSLVSKSLYRNRKIVPWLGVEVIPGEIEWYTLGTYWSYSWDVPVDGLTAKVIGFDTIGLLDTTSFFNHYVQINKSLGELVEYVLSDAKSKLDFITWHIDEALYDIKIPYAWFENASHAAALRRISEAYPMHIYCDRNGVIVAAPQRLRLDYYFDEWSNSTNVINKTYSSLHTTIPNVINVTVNNIVASQEDSLASDELLFDVAVIKTRTLTFNKTYLTNLSISMDKDDTVNVTYKVYSWGITFTFTGTGYVRSIKCSGIGIAIGSSAIISHTNAESVQLNGAVVRDITSPFIQTTSLASDILSRFIQLSTYDKYDAKVAYRGDISLTINDAIHLLDGIAPDNRYTIKRHELHWDGSLTASADLNT